MSELSRLADAIEKQGEALKDQGKTLSEIHLAVAGNEKYGQTGLKHTVADHEKRLGKLEKKATWKDWKLGAGAGVAGGAIGAAFPIKVWFKIILSWIGIHW